jgi:hypothetical protein
MHCPASCLLEQPYPKTHHPSADEGTAAAKLAEWDINNNVDPRGAIGTLVEGIVVTDEMAQYVMDYTAYCRAIGGICCKAEAEGRFDVIDHTVTGTSDFICYNHPVFHVVDLKYGFGWVYPENNWQEIAYAIMHCPPTATSVMLHIYQPRAHRPGGPAHTWEFNAELLRNYRNQIQNQTGVAALPNAPAVSGDHCRYCRAIIDCTTNQRSAGECMDVSLRSDAAVPAPIDIALELERIQVALDRLKHRATALEAHGISLIQSGTGIPGFEARPSVGDLQWTIDAIKGGDEMGVNLRAPEKPITPTQARDRKLIDASMLPLMTKREQKGFKLKRVDMDAIRRIING